MELVYDWKQFKYFFYSHKNVHSQSSADVFVFLEEGVVVEIFSEQASDVRRWIGFSLDQLIAEIGHGKSIFSLERTQFYSLLDQVMQSPHFYIQWHQLAAFQMTRVQPLLKKGHVPLLFKKDNDLLMSEHFFLKWVGNFKKKIWKFLLPRRFGIYLNLYSGQLHEKKMQSTFFLIFEEGLLYSFFVPDFNFALGDQPEKLIHSMSEKYNLPVQGMFLTDLEWEKGSWRSIAKAILKNHKMLVPFRWKYLLFLFYKRFF